MAAVSAAKSGWRQRIFPTTKTEPVPINGEPIKHRTLQKYAWAAGLGLLIGLAISGIYVVVTQMDWHVYVLGHRLFFKNWWDDTVGQYLSAHTWFINLENWATYRHNARNLGAPAIATVGVMGLVAGASKPASKLYSWVAPLILIVVVTAMLAGGTWLELISIDKVQAHMHGIAVGAITLVCSLILGFIIGRVTHPMMKGPGTRLQDAWTNFFVDLYWRLGGDGKVLPVWVRKPLAPVTARESAAKRIVEDMVNSTKHKHTGPPITEAQFQQQKGLTVSFVAVLFILALIVLVFFGLAFFGFIGHFWVGLLHQSFPWLG